jgi:hypothetical protein
VIDGCTTEFAAKKHTCMRHYEKVHQNRPITQSNLVVSVTAAPKCVVGEGEGAFPTTVLGAKKQAREASAAMFVSLETPPHQVDAMRGMLEKASVAAGGVASDTTMLKEGGSLDVAVTKVLKPFLQASIADTPGVLIVDAKGKNKYAGKKGLVHVMWSSAALDEPVLLHAQICPKGTSKNAKFYKELTQKVIGMYQIQRINIVGISVDNTNFNPCFVREIGCALLPCTTHVINLVIESVMTELKLSDMLGWKSYLAHSDARRDAMEAGGLNPRLVAAPSMKFGYSLKFYKAIGSFEAFTKWGNFARANPPEKKGDADDMTKNYNYLLASFNTQPKGDGMFTIASVVVANAVLQDIDVLLKGSQAGLLHLSFNFFDGIDRLMSIIEMWHSDCPTMLDTLLAKHPMIKLSISDKASLIKRTERMVEEMNSKINKHLFGDSVSNGRFPCTECVDSTALPCTYSQPTPLSHKMHPHTYPTPTGGIPA